MAGMLRKPGNGRENPTIEDLTVRLEAIYLEDKAMVESQGPIVDRTIEHPGYGDRAILLLRKMLREGIADVANGKRPKGVLDKELDGIELEIGLKEFVIDKAPEVIRDLIPEVITQVAKTA